MTDQYLDLLEQVLCFRLWPEPLKPISQSSVTGLCRHVVLGLDRLARRFGVALGVVPTNDSGEGTFWPTLAHTMVGQKRLENIRQLCRSVDAEGIPGTWVECGVWRGGASIYARACLAPSRVVVCCDSFRGFPSDEAKYGKFDCLRVSRDQVESNFKAYGLLNNVRFVEGYFVDTLSSVPGPIAILRCDGDTYKSTMEILTALYAKVAPLGYVIIDDWSLPSCQMAVRHYRERENITEQIVDIDGMGVFWRKNA